MKIAILDGYTLNLNGQIPEAYKKLGQVSCYPYTEDNEALERLQDVEIALIDTVRMDAARLEACSKLKYIGIMATGTNWVDLKRAGELGIAVTNVPAYSTPAVAQHTFALLLELTNGVSFHQQRNVEEFWGKGKEYPLWDRPHMELDGKTLGLIGYGSIGKKVAAIAQAFGMRILVYTDYPEKKSGGGPSPEFVQLEELLQRADVISLHKPMNEKNKKIINRDTLQQVKDGAILINTARGGLVDEEALAEALKTGKLAAAAVDVLTEEPPANHHLLESLPNCIVTPHLAWTSAEALERLRAEVLENLQGWTRGERRNRVER